MRETLFLMLGMLLGGTLGTMMVCMLQFGARHERVHLNSENSEARK